MQLLISHLIIVGVFELCLKFFFTKKACNIERRNSLEAFALAGFPLLSSTCFSTSQQKKHARTFVKFAKGK